MEDKIKASYRQSKDIYDDVLTQNKWWSRLYIRLFWSGVDDLEIAGKLLSYIPDDFDGQLLDVPVGTAVFTWQKYLRLNQASITCLDYSEDMLAQASQRFQQHQMSHVTTVQGDVGAMAFENAQFDIVLCMNGFHAFPDKEKAFAEIHRVLKKNGQLVSCFYISGQSNVTDWLVGKVLSKKGWFTKPFETIDSLKQRLAGHYDIEAFHVAGAMVYFCARKRD